MEVSEPHLFVFNKLVNRVHQSARHNLVIVFNFLFQLADLVVGVFPVHKGVEVGVKVGLNFYTWHGGGRRKQGRHAETVLFKGCGFFVQVFSVLEDTDSLVSKFLLLFN